MDADTIALFRELADRSASEREAYYAAHAVDAPRRAEVESLLRFDRNLSDSIHEQVASAARQLLHEQPHATARVVEESAVPSQMGNGTWLIGRRIGVFEVQSFVGAGGMGEVYRALDTRLGRTVAIKILPSAFRDDPEHVGRFEREARVLASLNHPHIGVVYGLEEVDRLKALVMEFVEGEDLAERLARGPLPIVEALDVARQIADALEAAHAQSIVHRDLKPANIRRRRDGTVKVLDFGLAKPLALVGDVPSATRTGAIRGTPAYMSPEQARGEPVDSRADIWSFGVVLFELLTGVSPFARQTPAETLVSVLTAAPDHALLPADTPPRVRSLIRRCVEKDCRRRLQHIGDGRIELEEALAPSADDSASSTSRSKSRVLTSASNAPTAAALVLLAGVLGAVIGAFWFGPRPATPVVRTMIPGATFVSTTDRSFAFTPDGSRLGYLSGDARQIFVRPLDALEPVPILTTAAYLRGLYPSPDGRWFAYVENNFTLRKIAAGGGPPLTVVVMDGPSRGAAWGPDDTIVFATGASDTGLQRVAAGGGPVTVLTRPDPARGERDHLQPVWLPGHRKLLFTITSRQGRLDAAKTAVLDLETGTWRTVLEGGFGARYTESGHLVYAAAGALWATRFDLSRLEARGAPVEILRPVTIDVSGATAEFDIAPNGTLAYTRGAISQADLLPVWVDRSGRETPLNAPHGSYRHPRLSPDAKRLAVNIEGDIYVWDLTRPWSDATRLTFADAIDWYPVWTPNAQRIVFGSWRGGGFSNVYVLDTNSGLTERLTISRDMQLPTSITPDGTTVVFHSFTKSLQAMRLHAGAEPVTLVETAAEERNGDISPDGRWIAYEGESTSRPGQIDVYVRPFPDVDRGLWQVTREGGTFPLWARNGRELFFVAPDGTMMAVPVEASRSAWRAGSPIKLFRGQYAIREGSLGRLYDVAPDGRFFMLKYVTGEHAPQFVIVQNWMAELARLVR